MIKYFKLLILILSPSFCFSGNPILFNNKNEIINITGSHISILEDKGGKLTFKDIVSSDNFSSNTKRIPNFGVSKSSFWLKFEIKNTVNNNDLLLNIAYPNLDEIELYSLCPKQKWSFLKMGKDRPFYQRNYQNPGYIFDLKIPLNETAICFLKIKSGGQILTPIYVGVSKKIMETIKTENLFIGIYCGVIIIMFFYNLFIFYAVRDKVYLFYVGYILVVGLVQLCLLGYTFQFFWPNSSWLAIHSVYLLSALVGISAIEFFKVFLQTKQHTPLLHKGFRVLNLVYLSYIIFDFFNFGAELYNIIQACALILSFYMIFVAIKISDKGFRPARFFLLAWSFFLIGVFIYALKDIGILPYNNFTLYSMPIGSAIETVLLSFALADKINILKKEKEASQASELKALKANEKLITDQNIILENKVEARTTELKHTNEELNNTLSHLKDTQTQLVSVEKMASLGQLTAGIAHEINNPINFVSANVKPLKMDFTDILELIKKYESITPETDLKTKLKDIENYKQQIDLTYLITEIESLLSGIDDGAKRTAEIVSGLKNFSRLDESDIKTVNINEGIQSTLILLKNAIPENTKVITDLGTIPNIECLPGKLNQVFMNILSNAIYAINKKKTDEDHKLIIKTYELNEHIYVSIEDTGIGMTDEVKTKVFDPFFTTKDVGEGTGLGMSIVFKIIESHHAKIEIESKYGVGTKILIILNKKININ